MKISYKGYSFIMEIKRFRLIIHGGNDIIFNTTKNPNICISIYNEEIGKRSLIILFFYDKEGEKDYIINRARKIYEELKYFSVEKLSYLDKIPDRENRKVILFRYSFKYSVGISSAIDTLMMEDFYED